MRFYDTAPLDGMGNSETRLGRALRARPRAEFTVATKVGRVERGIAMFDIVQLGRRSEPVESNCVQSHDLRAGGRCRGGDQFARDVEHLPVGGSKRANGPVRSEQKAVVAEPLADEIDIGT